jgi:hypothetical protein
LGRVFVVVVKLFIAQLQAVRYLAYKIPGVLFWSARTKTENKVVWFQANKVLLVLSGL